MEQTELWCEVPLEEMAMLIPSSLTSWPSWGRRPLLLVQILEPLLGRETDPLLKYQQEVQASLLGADRKSGCSRAAASDLSKGNKDTLLAIHLDMAKVTLATVQTSGSKPDMLNQGMQLDTTKEVYAD
jgi:hypothetical protein